MNAVYKNGKHTTDAQLPDRSEFPSAHAYLFCTSLGIASPSRMPLTAAGRLKSVLRCFFRLSNRQYELCAVFLAFAVEEIQHLLSVGFLVDQVALYTCYGIVGLDGLQRQYHVAYGIKDVDSLL